MGLFDTKTTGTANQIQNNTATISATPWKPVVGGANTILGQISSGLKQPATSADTNAAIGMFRNLATQGTPGLDQANGFLSSLYANANQPVSMSPYASQVADQASNRAVAGALSQASMAGRYGSGAATSGAVNASINAQMPFLNNEWNAAQGRQQQAQALALQGASMQPGFMQAAAMPASNYLQASMIPEQSYWNRLQSATGSTGVLGQLGGTKTSTGQGATYGTTASKQDGSDLAGWGGLIGSFW